MSFPTLLKARIEKSSHWLTGMLFREEKHGLEGGSGSCAEVTDPPTPYCPTGAQPSTHSREMSPDQERWNTAHTKASFCLSSYSERNSKEEMYINSPASLTVFWEHDEIMGEKIMCIVNRDSCPGSQVIGRPLCYCTYQYVILSIR